MVKKKEKLAIEKDALLSQKFSVASGIGKETAGMFKGASVVPQNIKIKTKIQQFIRSEINDANGCLVHILERRILGNDMLLASNSHDHLQAVKSFVTTILSSDTQLYELVREIDQYYGEAFQERPSFQRAGQDAKQDDPYTHESVRSTMLKFLTNLESR